jgi:hypothetical protein
MQRVCPIHDGTGGLAIIAVKWTTTELAFIDQWITIWSKGNAAEEGVTYPEYVLGKARLQE